MTPTAALHPPRASYASRLPRSPRRVLFCAGHIRPRSASASTSGRVVTLHVAASLSLVVGATALGAGRARAQQPGSPSTPPGDSARAAPVTAPAATSADSSRSSWTSDTSPPAPPGDSARGAPARPDSIRALARSDSTCAGGARTSVSASCVAAVLRGDTTARRGLLLVAGRKLLEHAQGTHRSRVPRTSGEYFRAAFGPSALLRAGAVAGFEQLLGRPRWLPRSRVGYAGRFGLTLGTNALATGIRYETARWLGLRPAEFAPCSCQGTGPRLAHALASPFRAETDLGERFSPFTPLTELSSGMVFAAVNGGRRPRQGLESGLTGLLSMSAVAVLREFRPWEKWLGR